MKIMTWNINSVRLRSAMVVDVMRNHRPDIVCLQETKCPDEFFPADLFAKEGYAHQHIHGMKSYNGVCILSRLPFENAEIHARVGREDCRHIGVSFKDFDLHNLYIPAGGDEPDRKVNEKFGHKLDFVDEMTGWFAERYSADKAVITLGDFNIAPREHDVWSHKQLLNVVSHTPVEVEKLDKMYASLDWTDAVRHFVPEEKKCYSWWSYRNRDWKKSNRGRRLDHIWVTAPLVPKLKSHAILTETRDLEKPSDHVPVMIELG
ncbi:MAG: exodeoxyribonuclease III [Rhodospirillales bacterium]|nr:exodeoxyribonuclease III [Alphaproteobacteria bacterium]USO04394.1 MAG: exodeoxyribonuclease III [Rhodospirillales bacterium]